jgi:hypothetical protein
LRASNISGGTIAVPDKRVDAATSDDATPDADPGETSKCNTDGTNNALDRPDSASTRHTASVRSIPAASRSTAHLKTPVVISSNVGQFNGSETNARKPDCFARAKYEKELVT